MDDDQLRTTTTTFNMQKAEKYIHKYGNAVVRYMDQWMQLLTI